MKTYKDIFGSILCLCVEGREVMSRKGLLDAIQKDAQCGYDLDQEPLLQEAFRCLKQIRRIGSDESDSVEAALRMELLAAEFLDGEAKLAI